MSEDDPIRRLVVTGAAGRVGAGISALARSGPISVTGIDKNAGGEVDLIGDIRDADVLRTAFEGADTVIHSAALHAPHVGEQDEEAFRSINIEGTRLALHAAMSAGVKRFVLTSTTALYGGGSDVGKPAHWVEDSSPTFVRTIYHETKLAAEALAIEAADGGLPVSIVRLGRCFTEPIPIMALHRLSRGIDIRDAASAHLCAVRFASLDPQPLIAAAETPFLREDCDELGSNAAAVIEKRCPELAATFRQHGWSLPNHIDRIYDSSAARRMWGWTPEHDFRALLPT